MIDSLARKLENQTPMFPLSLAGYENIYEENYPALDRTREVPDLHLAYFKAKHALNHPFLIFTQSGV